MKTIYKYPLKVTDRVTVMMPKGSKTLDIQVQQGVPCIWALVDTRTKDHEERTFEVYGTGHPFDESTDKDYVGTFQMNGGGLVFHAFEINKPKEREN